MGSVNVEPLEILIPRDVHQTIVGPYTSYVETLLSRKKSGSKMGRLLLKTSAHAMSAYDGVGPILGTILDGVPWFGPAASTVVQLLQRAINTGNFPVDVGLLALDIADLLDQLCALLKRCQSSGSVSSKGQALVDDKLFKPTTQVLCKVIALLEKSWGFRYFHLEDMQEQIRSHRAELPTKADIMNIEAHLITGQGIDALSNDLTGVHVKIDHLTAALNRKGSVSHRTNYEPLPPPPPPPVLLGREEDMVFVVSTLLKSRHVAVVGAGGMGKSSVALTVLEDPQITERYANRFFVRLDKAQTAGAMVAELHRMCPQNADQTRHPLATLREFLESLSGRILLVLDNFETPFDYSSEDAEDVLKRLSRVKTLTLLITTRNGTLRVDDDRSLSVHVLRSLSLHSAMDLFLQIASKHDNAQVRESAAFQGLLRDLDGHSLSIVLIARQAKQDEDIDQVCVRWQSEKTTLVQDYRRRYATPTSLTSLEASIKLSMESPIMNDAARRLLSVLAIFPDGLTKDIMLSLPDLDVAGESVESLGDRLLDTSLAFTQPGSSGSAPAFRLLVPIKEYIDKRTPHLADDVLNSLLLWVNEVASERELMRYTMSYILRNTPTHPQLSNLVDTAWRLMVTTQTPSAVSFGCIYHDILQKLEHLSSIDGGQRNQTACKMLCALPNSPFGDEQTEFEDSFEACLSVFISIGDVHKQAECLMLRGMCRSGQLRQFNLQAIEDFEKALQLSRTVPTAKVIAVECLLQLGTQYCRRYSPDTRPALDTSRVFQHAHECCTLLRTMHPKKLASGLRDLISSHFDCVETLPLARAEYDELIKLDCSFDSDAEKEDILWALGHGHAFSDDPADWDRAIHYAELHALLPLREDNIYMEPYKNLANAFFGCPSIACHRAAAAHCELRIKHGDEAQKADAYAALGQLYEAYPEDFGVLPGHGLASLTSAVALYEDSRTRLSSEHSESDVMERFMDEGIFRRLSHLRYWIGCVHLRLGNKPSARAAFSSLANDIAERRVGSSSDSEEPLRGYQQYFRCHLRLASEDRRDHDIDTAKSHITQSIAHFPASYRPKYPHTSASRANVLIYAHARYEHGLILEEQGDAKGAMGELLAAKDPLMIYSEIVAPRINDKHSGIPEGDTILPPLTLEMVEAARGRIQAKHDPSSFTPDLPSSAGILH